MASAIPPVKNTAFSFEIALVDQGDTDVFQTSVTLAAGDVKVSKDGGSFSNITTLPTEIGTSGVLTVALSATEMNADRVAVLFHDAAGAEWQDALVVIYTAAQTLDATDAVADTISGVVGHADYGNAKLVRSATPANALVVIASGAAVATVTSMAANVIDAASLAADAGTEIADAVRAELATELAHLDANVSAAGLDAAGTRAALGMAAANMDEQLAALPTAAESADAVRTNLATELAHLDADVSSAGGGLTAQETANAVHNLAPTGTPAANSIGDKLNTMPATILTTAVAAYANTPGTFGYLLSLLAGLDFTAITLVATSNAGEITIKRTLTLAAVVSGLTIPADWTACYWTVKRSTDDADADALVQTLASNPPDADDGLLILMGAAVDDQTAGSLTVNQALGTVTIALDDASTAALDDAVELVWDVKVHAPAGKTQPGAGTATITTTVTRT